MLDLKKEILENIIRSDGKLNVAIIRRDWYLESELHSSIMEATSFLDPTVSYQERIYCIQHDITDNLMCLVCNTRLRVFTRNHNSGYSDTCGDVHCKAINCAPKRLRTMFDTHGALVSDKARESTRSRVNQLHRGLQQYLETNNVSNTSQLEHVKQKRLQTVQNKPIEVCELKQIDDLNFRQNYVTIVTYNGGVNVSCRCNKCNNTFDTNLYTFKWRIKRDISPCIICVPKRREIEKLRCEQRRVEMESAREQKRLERQKRCEEKAQQKNKRKQIKLEQLNKEISDPVSDGKIQCMICGEYVHALSYSHLKIHGLTLSQYKEIFPDSPTMSDECRRKINESNMRSNQRIKGIPRTDEVKQKISQTKLQNPVIPWNKGKETDEAVRLKLSQLAKERFASGFVHWNLGNTTPQEVKEKISNTALSQNRTYSEESKAKRRLTMENKKQSGWVHHSVHRKGIKVTDPVILEKIRAASKRTNKGKILKALNQIMDMCDVENLTLHEVEDNYWLHLECNQCNTKFQYTKQIFRPSVGRCKNICPVCYPRSSGTSLKEIEMANFIKCVYTGEVLCNDRTVLGGKELDVYLPELNIAFEFNGLYWHSESVYNGNKHHLLHKQQYAYKKGIRIVHIYEDEWDNKRDIVESRIRQIIGVQQYSIHGRKCKIEQISNDVKNQFLNVNHIMGQDVSRIRYGAYFNDLLVAVMTFTPTNFVKGGNGEAFELNRFAVLKDHHIPGIASKMFKRFVNDHDPVEIVSYCDRRWNAGESYNAMGFEFVETTPPSYWYMLKDYKTRKHRSNFMKHKIASDAQLHLTEWEIMQQSGYDRIWDCGTLKFNWKRT